MLFAGICTDKPGALETRKATCREHLEHLDRLRPEHHQITEHPPPLDPEAFTVTEDRAESARYAVNVGHDPKSHSATVPAHVSPLYPIQQPLLCAPCRRIADST